MPYLSPSVSSKLASCDCPDFPNSGEKKENYGIIAGSLHAEDFILANFSPHVSIRYMEHDYPPAFWWGGNSIPHGAVVEQTDTSVFLQKEKCAKNLTGDVLIVALERKIATEIVDLHAAALLELPLEKLDGQRVLDPLLDYPLQGSGAIGRIVTFRRDFVQGRFGHVQFDPLVG